MGRLAVLALMAFTLVLALLVVLVVLNPLTAAFAIGVHPVPVGTPWTYQLLSGFVPAMAIMSLAGNVTTLWRLHTCAAPRCIRLGRHSVNNSPWCDRHFDQVKHALTDHDLLEMMVVELGLLRRDLKALMRVQPDGSGDQPEEKPQQDPGEPEPGIHQ